MKIEKLAVAKPGNVVLLMRKSKIVIITSGSDFFNSDTSLIAYLELPSEEDIALRKDGKGKTKLKEDVEVLVEIPNHARGILNFFGSIF